MKIEEIKKRNYLNFVGFEEEQDHKMLNFARSRRNGLKQEVLA